jgi:transcriptional regulator of met regulon
MPLTHYSKFSMFTLRIWVFKSGVLKKLFILSKHGTKANIRSTKMANNRHAYNRDVLQSYWTSDGLPLCCSQPTGEKTHTNQQCERLAKIRHLTVTTGHCSAWLDGCHSQPVPYSNNTGSPIDVCPQEQLDTVWNQRNLSQGESLNVHCW